MFNLWEAHTHMSGHHPYLLSHHAEKLENVFIENFVNQEHNSSNFLDFKIAIAFGFFFVYFSVFGPDVVDPDPEMYGLIPRTAAFLFSELERNSEQLLSCSVSLTVVEIYLEKIMDLIHPEVEHLKLWDATDGVFVEGLEPEPVESLKDVLNFLEISKGNRKVSFTKMNAQYLFYYYFF